MMDGTSLLGFVAGALTTMSFWPQLWKTWKTKSAGDVSLGMLLTFSVGVLLWLHYGVLLGAWPIIVTNMITALLTVTILILKLRYNR
jgi:MtN3 and saliva related transmembrane protein